MPIPKLSGDLTREQIIKIYKEEPYKWNKKITFDWIEINQRSGNIIKKTYEFNADSIPCTAEDNCASLQLRFVILTPSGVMATCANCRRTDGPLAFEDGRIVKQTNVDEEEAWKTIKKTGQKPPIGLQPLRGTERFRVVS